MNDVALSITLSYAELLTLCSAVSTINCVYGENEVSEELEFTLRNAVTKLSQLQVCEVRVEA